MKEYIVGVLIGESFCYFVMGTSLGGCVFGAIFMIVIGLIFID